MSSWSALSPKGILDYDGIRPARKPAEPSTPDTPTPAFRMLRSDAHAIHFFVNWASQSQITMLTNPLRLELLSRLTGLSAKGSLPRELESATQKLTPDALERYTRRMMGGILLELGLSVTPEPSAPT